MHASLSLKQVLREEAESVYRATEKLIRKVSDSDLSWKPTTGPNWMTLAQLLMHCASFGCGKAMLGFVHGDWGSPGDQGLGGEEEVVHLPPAEVMPSVECVEEALDLLTADRLLALRCIDEVRDDDLLGKKMSAPWGGREQTLFQHLYMMIAHLAQHKGQLFYYLKLLGKDVRTEDLWGV